MEVWQTGLLLVASIVFIFIVTWQINSKFKEMRENGKPSERNLTQTMQQFNRTVLWIVGVVLVLQIPIILLPVDLSDPDMSTRLTVEVITSSDHLIKWGFYFNMSEAEIDQCPILKTAVLNLTLTGEEYYDHPVTYEERSCIRALLDPKQPASAFYYQGVYYSLVFSGP